jgi:hypothetical protein
MAIANYCSGCDKGHRVAAVTAEKTPEQQSLIPDQTVYKVNDVRKMGM